MKPQLAEAGLPDTLPGRHEADRLIRLGLGMSDADCPEVWRAVKAMPREAVVEVMKQGQRA